MKSLKLLKKLDIIIIICLIILSFSPIFIFNIAYSKENKAKYINISVDGKIVETLDITKNGEHIINTPSGNNTISIKDGIISMIEADCKDDVCVKTPAISKSFQSIICLPHKLIVEIRGKEENHSDDDMIFSY